MPHTKLSSHSDTQKDLANRIKAESYALYGSYTQAAPHGISQPTLTRRLKDVDSFSIRELRGLRTALKS